MNSSGNATGREIAGTVPRSMTVPRGSSTVLVWVACALVASAAGAQTARGTVRDADSGVPVAGVVVLALDSAAGVRARSVANALGEYRLPIERAVRLRFVRIGYKPEERDIPRT